MRDAPSIAISRALLDAGAIVTAYDPQGMEQAKPLLGDVTYAANAYDCVAGADAACIVTERDMFRALDLDRVASSMKSPVLVDLRNIYRTQDMQKRGFKYTSVGRQGT